MFSDICFINHVCKICPVFNIKQMAELFHFKQIKKICSDLIFSLQTDFKL